MRNIISAITATALALSLVGSAVQPANAAVAGYNSSYFGESAFLTLNPGQTGQFVAIFTNTGANGWLKASASQVNLGACLDDKVTCNVSPEEAAWNDGSWLSSIAYATTSTDFVGPGQNGFFVYNVKVPATATAGTTVHFNGDLVLGSTLQQIRPEGYFQDVTVTAAATGSTVTTYSGTVPGTVTGNGTATAPAGATVTGVNATWTNLTTGATGSLGCSPTDANGFNELAEGFTCSGTVSAGAATDLIKIVTTGSYSNATTSTETDYLNETARPTVLGSYSGTTGKYTGICPTEGAQDTQTAITNAQYQLINAADGTVVRDWTDIPPFDGAYNEKCESISFTPDISGVASGTTLTLNVRARDAVGYGTPDTETITAATTGDSTKPVIASASVSRSTTNLRAKGTATDNVAVSSVQCKLQKLESGIYNDVTGFVAATADDGAFNETSEAFTANFGAIAVSTATYRAICNATDSSGNVSANFTTADFADAAPSTTPNATVTCTFSPTATTTNSASIVFTGSATDPEGVANVQFAVVRGASEPPAGTTVQAYTNATPSDGAFNETTESYTFTFVYPTGTGTDGIYHFLTRVIDANGNTTDPAATTGVNCSHQDIVVDRTQPLSTSASKTDAGTSGSIDSADTLTIVFNETVAVAAGATITISDGTNSFTFVNGTSVTIAGSGTNTLTLTGMNSGTTVIAYGATTIVSSSNGITDVAGNSPNWAGSADRTFE